jgi:RNA polymerase sigma factor (sigma-70 family)
VDLIARAGLSPREKEAFELRRKGLQQKEIAASLGIQPGTVKALLFHADQKLRAEREKIL